jgi:hypothetical protein
MDVNDCNGYGQLKPFPKKETSNPLNMGMEVSFLIENLFIHAG